VCHAEENGYIGDVIKDVFEPTDEGRQLAVTNNEEPKPPKFGLVDPRIAFSLAPMTTVNFSLYDDFKFSLGGIITDKEFSERVKRWFLHIFALKLNKLVREQYNLVDGHVFKIMKGSLSDREINAAKNLEDPSWIDYLQIGEARNLFNSQAGKQGLAP
jgi:hypothetical protein